MVAVLADSGHNCEPVLWGKVRWSEVLNHIVKDEDGESVSLDLSASKGLWDELGLAFVDNILNGISVGLEEGSDDLSASGLQIVLVRVLLLDESQVLSIELLILILSFLLGELSVLLDSLK